MKKLLSTALFVALQLQLAYSQDYKDEFEKFRNETKAEYNDFRKECYDQYLEFVKQAWKEVGVERPLEMPKEEPVLPEIIEMDKTTEAWLSNQVHSIRDRIIELYNKRKAKRQQKKLNKLEKLNAQKENKRKEEKLKIGKTIALKTKPQAPQPQPIAPVKEVPAIKNDYKSCMYLGTECKVRIGEDCRSNIERLTPSGIANAMKKFKEPQFDNLLFDCLQLRDSLHLSDWGYLQMLKTITTEFYGNETNEATLLTAFLYMQSGYKMRLGHDDIKLYMLPSCQYTIYGQSYFNIEGEKYYILSNNKVPKIYICNVEFPKEQSLSLVIREEQSLAMLKGPERTICSIRYPDFSFAVSENLNLIQFFHSYPQSTIGSNTMMRWAMYANTPLSSDIKNQLYPQMRAKLVGLSDYEAVNRLLNWVQTGFVYKYDDNVWGTDRALFGEETLFYPYCDCEDRAILFSHLVRDLLGLKVALVHYPGHLAAAVNFKEDIAGSYFMHEGKRFVVCDPTIIGDGADVGVSMDKYRNSSATLITLENKENIRF